ncbi:hypothetical protein K678_01526 [Magnetospirillum fulvum MGU-K5]|uniref:Uncharacterized protein n=2 Tax=Magnetospirillum fulvum TaxID=1082 RepID=S9SBJ5_MAGFU|nr:hypothetical protein K678_01526 [Magnetospirillum fulvum MGU-K5]
MIRFAQGEIMLFGRVTGWLLVGLAVIMASADAVMALGPADYVGLITADFVLLLAGHTPDTAETGRSLFDTVQAMVLDLPAWVVVGTMGVTLSIVCRHRPRWRRPVFRR